MSTRLVTAQFETTPSEHPGTIRTCGWMVVFLLLFVGADTNGYTLTTLLAESMLIGACAVAVYRNHGLPANSLNYLAGAWLAVTLIALATGYVLGFGNHMPFTEEAFSPGPLGPARLFFDQTAALASFCLAGFPKMQRSMRPAILTASGAILVFAIIEFAIGWNKLHSLPRLQATFGNPNLFASFLVMTIPVTLSSALDVRGRPTITAIASTLFVGLWAALLLTQSRAAFLGAGVGVLLVACVWWTSRLENAQMRRRRGSGLVFALAVGIVLCGAAGFVLHRHSFGRTHSVSDAQRLVAWHAAMLLIEEHPATGVGLGGFPAGMASLNLLEPNGAAGAQSAMVHAVNLHAHDLALQYWAERGIGGLLLVLALIAVVVVSSVRKLRGVPATTSSSYSGFMFSIGCLGAVWGWLVQNGVDYTLWYAPILMLVWTLLGAHFSWPSKPDEIKK